MRLPALLLLLLAHAATAEVVQVEAESIYRVHNAETEQQAALKARRLLHENLLEAAKAHIKSQPGYKRTLHLSGLYQDQGKVNQALEAVLQPQIEPREMASFWSGKSFWVKGVADFDDRQVTDALWHQLGVNQEAAEPSRQATGEPGLLDSLLGLTGLDGGVEKAMNVGGSFRRAQNASLIAEAIAQTQGVKIMLTEFYMVKGHYPATLAELGIDVFTEFAASRTVERVATDGKGTLIVELDGVLAGERLVWEPQPGGRGWDCYLTVPATDTMPVGSCQHK